MVSGESSQLTTYIIMMVMNSKEAVLGSKFTVKCALTKGK